MAPMIGSTMVVQFATWPASVSCYRVWPDRDRFCIRPACVLHWRGTLAAASRETTTMAIPGNVTPLAQPAQDSAAGPVIRTIRLSDLHDALRLGWEDFKAVPSHAIILCVIYPILGLVLARTVLGYFVLPLLFPLAAGFALLGPFAALGLFELSSRRRNDGLRRACADDARGMVADRGRLRRRFPVRRGRVVHQRGRIPVDARPARRRRRCHGDIAPCGRAKPGADGGMGL